MNKLRLLRNYMYPQRFGVRFIVWPHFLEFLNSAGPDLPKTMLPVNRTGVKGIEQVL